MRPMLSIAALSIAAFVAGAATAQPAPGLLGAWYWENPNINNPGFDEAVYRPDGTGDYIRRGKLCYTFTYKVTDDVLETTAGAVNTCGVGLVHRYQIRISGQTLTQKFIPNGFTSFWSRTKPRTP